MIEEKEYGINVITNPNIIKLFDSVDATIKYTNFINRMVTTDIPIPIDIRYISDTYPNISKNVYKYTLVSSTKSVLDNLVTKTSISSDYKVVLGGTPVVIANVVDTSERVFHTSFIVTYLKDGPFWELWVQKDEKYQTMDKNEISVTK